MQHYLRGEDGIYYEDLYHLVKFLPAYAMPASIPSVVNLPEVQAPTSPQTPTTPTRQQRPPPQTPQTPTRQQQRPADLLSVVSGDLQSLHSNQPSPLDRMESRPDWKRAPSPASAPHPPVQSTPEKRKGRPPPLSPSSRRIPPGPMSPRSARPPASYAGDIEAALLPARNPPPWGLFDTFPFSLLVKHRTRHGKETAGRKAARMRAKLRSESVSHNLPLEISLYLSSYVGALQARKTLDAPTTS
jgi:putative membrane protein